jgi:hypothetical protein
MKYAELSFGAGVVMLGTASDEQLEQTPWNLPNGHGIYVYVEDLETITSEPRSMGQRLYIHQRILNGEHVDIVRWISMDMNGVLAHIDHREKKNRFISNEVSNSKGIASVPKQSC